MKTQKQRIFSILAILTMAVILTCIFAACDKVGEKQVPVYKGMTISRSFARASAMTASDAENSDLQGEQGRVEGDYDKRDDDFDQNKPFEDPNAPSIENKANSTLDVVGAAESIYYADKNQDIFITIRLSNPDSYEILSFTLNGKKYSNYMFESGSDMENLVLKVNVGDVGGIVEYTIDAIKYVDGTDIKDVRMDGDRTVKAGVRASDQTYVNVTNEQKTMTSITFDAQVVDLYSLIEKSGGYAKAVLYDGVNMLIKDVKVGEKTNVVFDNLTPNTVYQYGVVALYDNLSGNGAKLNTLYKKAVYTDTIVLFKDVQVGKESIEWGFLWNESFASKQMSEISLWQNDEKVHDVDTGATRIDGLKSNNKYTLKATYKNLQNQDETIAIEFVTYAKAVPTVEIANVQSTQAEITFELNVTDTDNVGAITKIELLHGDDEPIVASDLASRSFENLLSNNNYTVKVTYTYDLNDGVGEQQIVKTAGIKTKAKAVPTVEIANVQSTQTEITFELNVTDTDNVGAITKIELLHGEDAPIVASDLTSRSFENLLSNNDYIIKVTYVYDLNNGAGEKQIVKAASIKTKAKATPSATISNLNSTQGTIECDVAYVDEDSVGSVVEIALYRLENKIKSVPFATHVSFDGLESGKEYKVVVTYKYDLNDGKGDITANVDAKYSTLVDSIVVNELILLNNNVVKLGEELNLRVYFTNSSEIELTGIYVNGQKATVVGGDRIESAIVKFVPETSGLCRFAIDRVDYIINGVEVNQTIDSSVEVKYPIYRDINITYTPITISKYEDTGDGVYISFDNEDGYTVFKVNEEENFSVVGDGKIYTQDIYITSIEYGYADYGHTTQKCNYKVDRWDTHYVTALKRIYTADEFFAMTDGYYLLMNDLDLRSTQTKAQIKLTGIFDANGHTIRGLSNIEDTSKNEYYDLFQGGSIYDAVFKELYVSINHADSSNHIYVSPLGKAKLYNCTVKGDITLSEYLSFTDLCIAGDSTTYSLNVTQKSVNGITNYNHTATNTIAKNEHIVERDDVFYFDCEVGKAFLSFANSSASEYTVEDGTFFVRDYAFADSRTLRSVTMPTTVQNSVYVDLYGNDAYNVFKNCTIEYATIPIGLLEHLNREQREYLVSLTMFGGNATYIVDNAFTNCTNLVSVVIPDSVVRIGGGAFTGCTKLTNVTIGNNVTSIGYGAFDKCSSLISIVIPNSVTNIEEFAFNECTSLSSLTLGGNVTNIKYCSFQGCVNLTSVTIPNSVTSIGDSAFNGCSGLTSVTIPDSVTSIGDSAFWGCSGLTSVTIGNSVTSICNSAFINCTGLTSVAIGNSVMSIGSSAFESCRGLISVTIPDSVTSIGASAFWGCSGLTSVVIGNGVTSIDCQAFNGCSGLTSVVIPDSVTSIGDSVFSGCSGLTSVIIGKGVTNIGDYAFSNCNRLTSVVIPDSVTSIGDDAFYYCTGLTSVTIGNSVTSLGDYAFYGCSGLTNITIPESVTSLGDYAFYGCSGLTSITIPESVTSIGDSAFFNCSSLTSITIPSSVTSIGKKMFMCCYNLSTINFEGTIEQWDAIAKGKDWNKDMPNTCQIVCIDGTISVGKVE